MPANQPTPMLHALVGGTWDRPSTKDWARVLSQLPLFAQVKKRHLSKIAALARVADFEPRDVIIREGEPADSFHLVLEGRARVQGKPRAKILRTGDYFGEMALIDGAPRSATIAADGPLRTMVISRKPFLRLLEKEPSIALSLLAQLAGRVRQLEKNAD
jgi:CRP-like cAMP-binding protein